MKEEQWWDKSWNPMTGCSPCSIGCKFCWAKAMAKRFGNKDFAVKIHLDRLEIPLHWRKPRRIFVCSMGDLFHEKVPFEFIDRVMFTIYKSYKYDYLFKIVVKLDKHILLLRHMLLKLTFIISIMYKKYYFLYILIFSPIFFSLIKYCCNILKKFIKNFFFN